MIKKLKSYLMTSTLAVTLVVPLVGIVTTMSASAATTCSGVTQGVVQGVNAATNQTTPGVTAGTQPGGGIGSTTGSGAAPGYCSSTSVSSDDLKHIAAKVTDIFSIIVGAASVIMIIYGGFRYIISGGESGRVGAAKNSLIYAIVGLVIVAIAQLIVHFVLYQSTQLGS